MNNCLIERFLEANRNNYIEVFVLGDAMVDEYYFGEINRISPEFPVCVFNSDNEDPVVKPGGAANTVHQFKNFNANGLLITYSDRYLKLILDKNNINYLKTPDIDLYHGKVPVKKRFLHDKTQTYRWDVEKPYYGLSDKFLIELEETTSKNIACHKNPNIIIMSDYNKGFFSDAEYWMSQVKKYKVPIIVDPKNGPVEKWQGCHILKPNAKEAKDLSGKSNWKEQCDYFVSKTHCDHVVITYSSNGIKGFSKKVGYWEVLPEKQVVVESVSGAGDCFISILTLAVALGFTVKESCEIAQKAGNLYVQKSLNRPIVPAELQKSKIVHPSDLKKRDFKLVFTNGCFDILHAGHIKVLQEAKKLGDKLIVGLNSDESVKVLKGTSRPINKLEDRIEVLRNLNMVDFITVFDEPTPIEVIKKCMPDVMVKGGDYKISEIAGHDIVNEVHTIPLIENLSTTNILKKIEGNSC